MDGSLDIAAAQRFARLWKEAADLEKRLKDTIEALVYVGHVAGMDMLEEGLSGLPLVVDGSAVTLYFHTAFSVRRKSKQEDAVEFLRTYGAEESEPRPQTFEEWYEQEGGLFDPVDPGYQEAEAAWRAGASKSERPRGELAWMLKETWAPQTLTAWTKERLAEGLPLPEGFEDHFEIWSEDELRLRGGTEKRSVAARAVAEYKKKARAKLGKTLETPKD